MLALPSMRRVGFCIGLLVSGGCAPNPDGGGASTETSDTDDSGDGELDCTDEWALVEEKPLEFTRSYASDDLLVAAGRDQVAVYAQGVGRVDTLPEQIYPWGVWAAEPESVWLIETTGGAGGDRILHWDGETLTTELERPASTDYLLAIWGAADDDIWAVGRKGCVAGFSSECEALLYHYDGNGWEEQDGIGMAGLSSLWGRGSDDVFIAGQHGQSAHFDGNAWTLYPTGSDDVTLIAGDAGFTFALGGSFAYRWHGSGWSALGGEQQLPGAITDIAVVDGNLWGLEPGFGPRLFRWDGDWSEFEFEYYQALTLDAFEGEPWVMAGNGWLAGSMQFLAFGAEEELELRWSADYVSSGRRLRARSLDEAYILGQTTLGFSPARFDGADWRWLNDDAWRYSAYDLWVEGPGRVWTIGRDDLEGPTGAVVRMDFEGESQTFDFPTKFGDAYPRSIWAGGPEDLWVLGDLGAYHFDGDDWYQAPFPAGEAGISVRGVGGHNYMLGQKRIYELLNGQWTILRDQANYNVDFDVAGPLSVWAIEVDEAGESRVVAFDGAEWTSYELGMWTLCGIQARAPDDVYVLGYLAQPGPNDRNVVIHFDGSRWSRIAAPDVGCAQMRAVDDGIILTSGQSTYTLSCQ